MKLIKELKGGSLSKTMLLSDGQRKWVRKFISIDENREYGLVRWHSQMRKSQLLNLYLPENTLPVLKSGILDDKYFFDLPYIENCSTLCDALMKGLDPSKAANAIFDILTCLVSHSLQANTGSFAIYINEEIMRPLLMAQGYLSNSGMTNSECKIMELRIDALIEKVRALVGYFTDYDIYECVTHGNLTLENILWNHKIDRPILIDSYAETYCETILGDASQVLQSSRSGYEFISQLLSEGELEVTKYPYEKIPKVLIKFSEQFESLLVKEFWYDEKLIQILRASQFTRMFPFKMVVNKRAGYLFLNHAIDLLEDI